MLDDASRFLEDARAAALLHFGLRLGLFNALERGPIASISELAAAAGTDMGYTQCWGKAACAAGLIAADSQGVRISSHCLELLPHDNSVAAARVLQALYSVQFINLAIGYARRGSRPGYNAIDELTELRDWYGFISEALARPLWEREVAPSLRCLDRLRSKPGVIADFGGGSGWLTRLLRDDFPESKCISVVERRGSEPEEQLTVEEFRASSMRCDIILLIKVAHHLGDAMHSTIKELSHQLTPGGALVIWDIRGEVASASPPSDAELAFLNLVEYAQRAHFIPTAILEDSVRAAGLLHSVSFLSDGKGVVIEAVAM